LKDKEIISMNRMNPTPLRRDILAGWTVLVIDDEPDSLYVASRLLRHYGAVVSTAPNGKEGLQLAKTVRPKLIVSDISMPVMDGWDLINALKNDRTLLDIPVIALTAHAMTGDRERALSAGFHNYLTKPLTPATFIRDLLILLVDVPEFAAQAKDGLGE
jgi:CheY-like chemotaxis protein